MSYDINTLMMLLKISSEEKITLYQTITGILDDNSIDRHGKAQLVCQLLEDVIAEKIDALENPTQKKNGVFRRIG